ncbi:toxin-antitoxin system YwqK family antitoxin [Pontibacter ramchanderi]|uniref:Antitoxin component YwqK of YwqJK toxin-antitoxin module n=1 Tax=Pontibacter ramchanderi TaxID=1179743 RepID=A0A2N3V0Z7_9BACT|nr:hypothetical protein [Pontibacter ramchanderi]PKV75292.1 antitoxin component YwqK of YwqJK toxin-antitoxin module [Pontibacter ramchanderi]
MKTLLPLLITLLLSTNAFSQKLTLQELVTLCDKQSWESVNTTLSAKGWVYHDSKKGDDYNYNTITWSYNKDYYSDKANAWFKLFTYEGHPNKVTYTVFNKPAYTLIANSITSSGYKLVSSAIEDNELISTYANNSHLVKINTEKREDDDWSERSITAYQITVIKKAGVYDPNNGKKTSYHEDGEIEAEYTLKDGELHGAFKSYYDNGQLQKQGNYLNGKGNGKFVEFDEDGDKTAEYTMLNGEVHGLAKIYEGGLLSEEKEYVNGVQTGNFIDYYYDSETEKPTIKVVGSTIDGKKSGKWTSYYVADGQEEPLEYWHYKDGLKHGEAKEFIGSDSLQIATYANGKLHGPYKRKVKLKLTDTETGEQDFVWDTDCEGEYNNGLKHGKWTYYYMLTKLKEGRYANDKREGIWSYFIPVGSRSGQVMLESNYSNDKKNGLEKRYFFMEEVEDNSQGRQIITYKAFPALVKTFYKDDLKNGDYEYRDSTNILVDKGSYLNDEKHGQWLEGYIHNNPDDSRSWLYYAGEYKNGKEEGKWISYFDRNLILTTSHFRAGKLNGELIEWNELGKPAEKKIFENGDLRDLTIYDSAGEKIMNRYEIYNENSSSFICRQSEYFDDKIVSQEYRIFRQEKIHHNDFERLFLNLTGITSSKVYGYKDGEYKMTTPAGESLITGKYLKEDKIGQWTYTYPSQQVVMELNYEKGQAHSEKYRTLAGQPYSGEFVYYDATAGLKEERKIKNGLRNGRTTYLDSNNKAIRKENYKEGALK